MAQSEPFLLDLATLTQEQLDLAMANPGSCKYSGPCILGAMMPPELIQKIKDDEVDNQSVYLLDRAGYVRFGTLAELQKAEDVQRHFDNTAFTNPMIREYSVKELSLLLPHLKVELPSA